MQKTVGRSALIQTPFLVDVSYWAIEAAYEHPLYYEITRPENSEERASVEKTAFQRKVNLRTTCELHASGMTR